MSRTVAVACLLATLLALASAVTAEKPESPPGQSGGGNGSAHGDGQGAGNGNAQGNAAASGPAQGTPPGQDPAGPPAQSNGAATSPAAPDESPAAQQAADHGNSGNSGNAPGHASPAPNGESAASASQARGPGGAAPEAAGAPADETAGSGPVADVPVLTDASDALSVERSRAGNLLRWTAPELASQVQVWRLDGDGWVPVAVAPGTGGEVTDPAGGAMAQYRLTWSSEALGASGLALAATTLPLAPALREGSGLGPWLAGLMWAGVAVVGLVRANAPRRVLDVRAGPEHAVVPLLAGLPGVDVMTLERISALGVRTVGQMRAVDPDALAFWARVPATMVRHWKETVELLVWPALPPGAGERLALAGHGTLAHLASAEAIDLHARLRSQSGVDGPGVPADAGEVANWVVEARQALGLMAVPGGEGAPPTSTPALSN